MSDSPAVRALLDPKEQPILDSVLYLRDQLSLLKQDRSTYIKSHDVLRLYEQVIEQVHLLNVIRAEHDKALEQTRGQHVRPLPGRLRSCKFQPVAQANWKYPVDNVLDDCFQLISLFFLTIGRNNEAPAV